MHLVQIIEDTDDLDDAVCYYLYNSVAVRTQLQQSRVPMWISKGGY